jgi:hypothetical protein
MKTKMIDTVVGLSIPDLIEIQHKLEVMRLDTKDLLEFLDRDKVQLFAEKIDEIKTLKSKLKEVSKIVS